MYTLRTKFCQPTEPQWRDAGHFLSTKLPLPMRAWLEDTGSLTARLRKKSAGQFSVRVLNQAWALPHFSERELLEMGEREWGLVREVLLCGRGEPWVFARSVMPARSLVGDLRQLRQLDSRPLGPLLFNTRSMRRGGYQFCQMPVAMLSQDIVGGDEQALWGRRSRFDLRDRPIMVSEIFLPAFQP
ncbi:chorismate lyase [Spongiibacter sp. IMCC21906]|nr:chorismate lyase [Spongiibacter sp. IMCC21906]